RRQRGGQPSSRLTEWPRERYLRGGHRAEATRGGSMFLLPAKIGPFTLMRRLRANGVSEAFAGVLTEPPGRQVRVHRIVPSLVRSEAEMPALRARVEDLRRIDSPTLVGVRGLVEEAGDAFVLDDWVDGITLQDVVDHCRATQ